jgi:hypothetical protein
LATGVLATAIVGCQSSPSAAPPAPAPNPAAKTASAAPTTPLSPPTGLTPAAQIETAAAPVGAKYTIFCTAFNGPARVQQATVSKDNLIRGTGRREFYVVHEEDQSTLYYGYYKERERSIDAKEAARASKDLEYIRGLGTPEGQRFFGRSLIVPLPLPDVEGPAEYDLTKLDQNLAPEDPKKRFWTIAVADYTNDARNGEQNRKQLAIESVIDMRKNGIEAYYYNGPNTSTVCIGAWPRSAIREQEVAEARTKADIGKELLVSNGQVNQQIVDGLRATGRDIEVFQPKVEYADPALLQTHAKYDTYYRNGVELIEEITDPATGKKSEKKKPSFLAPIPQTAPKSMLDRNQTVRQDEGPRVVNPMAPAGGSGGRLRSVTP